MFLSANFNIQIIGWIHVYMQCLDILVFLSWPSAVPSLVWSGWQPRWPAIDWPASGSSVRWTYGWSPISWATTMPGCAAPQPASWRPSSPVHTSETPSDKPEISSALIKKWRWVNFFFHVLESILACMLWNNAVYLSDWKVIFCLYVLEFLLTYLISDVHWSHYRPSPGKSWILFMIKGRYKKQNNKAVTLLSPRYSAN